PARHWSPRARGDDPRVLVQAEEANSDAARFGERGRMMRVLAERLDTPMSPLQYLDANFGAGPSQNQDPGEETWDVSNVRIGKQEGARVTVGGLDLPRRDEAYDPFAGATLPSLRAVVVHIHGSGEPTHADRAAVASIAGSITAMGEPASTPAGETVTLSGQR